MDLQIDSINMMLAFSSKVGISSIGGIRDDGGTLEKCRQKTNKNQY